MDATVLCKYTVQQIPPHIQDLTVVEMWDANSGWKWRLFTDLLPNVVLTKITRFEIQPGEGTDDQLVWDGASHGGFSFQIVISIIRRDTDLVPDLESPLPQRIDSSYGWLDTIS